MIKLNSIVCISLFFVFFVSEAQENEFISTLRHGDQSMVNRIYNYIKYVSPECIPFERSSKFTVYFNSKNEILDLKIYLDGVFMSQFTTYYDLHFPNLVLSIENELLKQNSIVEIFFQQKRIEFEVNQEVRSVYVHPSFDVTLVEFSNSEQDNQINRVEKKQAEIQDEVIIEFFNFDYVYDYIPAFNCFKRTGKKLFE